MMEDFVLWKPLYYFSIGMFALSLILFPFSAKWSIIIILTLVALWSRVPGFVHFIFNKLAINDLFTLIIAANMGGLAGGLFGAFTMLFSRAFGPNEWWPYTLRATIALFVGGISVPFIVASTGGVNVAAVYWFEGVVYAVYYIQILLLWRDEIGTELMVLPAVIIFDFFLNAFWIKMFGDTLSKMMTSGLGSGWPFIIFAGLILFFLALAKNGRRIVKSLEPVLKRLRFSKKSDDGEENFHERTEKES